MIKLGSAAFGFLVALICAAHAELRFEHAFNIGVSGSGPGQFGYVEDFAFSGERVLLVTDASHAWVQVFDRVDGKFLGRFGGKGDGEQHLEKPEGIAVDGGGNIYIADYTTGYIKKYDTTLNWVDTFSEYGTEPGQTMKSEFMDIRDNRLYVPEAGNHRISVFDLSGRLLFTFGRLGSGQTELNNPESAKFGPDGRLYVADLMNDRIQVFDAEGHFIETWGKAGAGKGELKSPAGISFDRDGNVYATEIGNNRVQVFSPSGKFIAAWGEKGSANGQFSNLHGVIVDKETGFVYVADTGNNRVQVFKPVKPTIMAR
jgi:DNA-binding beta-propeller fold protein YncE